MRERRRVLWVAGSRSELLVLGPLFKSFYRPGLPHADLHWFMVTGEQGMPLYQSLDHLELNPNDRAEIRHPNEDPAIRLYGVMESVEQAARRHRATHLIFSGFQATASAASQVCLARETQGVWLKLPDSTGLVQKLHWERGLEAQIESLVKSAGFARLAVDFPLFSEAPAPAGPVVIAGRRPDAPCVLVQFGRRQWSVLGSIDQLVFQLAGWARAFPAVDWLAIRSLNARMEGALFSMPDPPSNLLNTAPLPWPAYRRLLRDCALVVTDCPVMAHEASRAGKRVLGLGNDETVAPLGEPFSEAESSGIRFTTPRTMTRAAEDGTLAALLESGDSGEGPAAGKGSGLADYEQARRFIEEWLEQSS